MTAGVGKGWTACVPSLSPPTKAEGGAGLGEHPTHWPGGSGHPLSWNQHLLHPAPGTALAGGSAGWAKSPVPPAWATRASVSAVALEQQDGPPAQGERVWPRGGEVCRDLRQLPAPRATLSPPVPQVPAVDQFSSQSVQRGEGSGEKGSRADAFVTDLIPKAEALEPGALTLSTVPARPRGWPRPGSLTPHLFGPNPQGTQAAERVGAWGRCLPHGDQTKWTRASRAGGPRDHSLAPPVCSDTTACPVWGELG